MIVNSERIGGLVRRINYRVHQRMMNIHTDTASDAESTAFAKHVAGRGIRYRLKFIFDCETLGIR